MMRARLGLMMFLEYFVWGAWYVSLGAFLELSLHFNGQEVGWTAGTTAIGAMAAPFLVGLIADRFFATQRVLAVLHLVGAALLWLASVERGFLPVYLSILAYSLFYMPTLALTNALAFRQMQDAGREFGAIRVFGSLGWIVAGLIVGHLGIEATALPLRMAAGSSLLLGLYCFTLPHTPALADAAGARGEGAPIRAWGILRERSTAVFAFASLLICIPLQFYYAFTNLFLNEIGVTSAAAKMSGGQMSELACMVLIPFFFRHLGVKYMLAVGMLAWVGRYILFALGDVQHLGWMLWAGILLHGICYDFFFVTGQIYIDRRAPKELRTAAQGLITLLTYGVGMFLGAWLSGRVVDLYALPGRGAGVSGHDWRAIWMFAAGGAAVVLILFTLVFVDDREPAQRTVAART